MRKIDGLGIAGLLMLVVGAGTFFGARGFLPVWLAWLVGPLLWYLGFAVVVAWLGFRIFGGATETEEEARPEAAQESAVPTKRQTVREAVQPVVVIHVRSNFHEHDWDLPVVEGKPGNVTWAAIAGKIPMAGIALVAWALLFSPALHAAEAAATFKAKCAMCHGADAAGKTVMGAKLNIRDLRSAEVQKQSDAELLQAITKGKNKMPAFDGKLSADEIKALEGYIRELGKKH